jgi:hemoglobin-like flavoprotein
MVADVSYAAVMEVTNSWDRLKMVPDYKNKAGELIFTRLFEIEPTARSLFGFVEKEELRSNPKFGFHANQMISMIDSAVALLGPDLEPLREDLNGLGKRHIAYGVKEQYLPVMEKAVVYAMDELLGKGFSRSDRDSWKDVFYFMVTEMIQGMY